jgi:prophage regulatory protein
MPGKTADELVEIIARLEADNAALRAERKARQMLTEVEVLKIVPFGRTTMHGMIKKGLFPRGTYASPNSRFWFLDQILRWQDALEDSNPHFNANRRRGGGRRPRIAMAKAD